MTSPWGDSTLERVARAIYERMFDLRWEDASEIDRAMFTENARAASLSLLEALKEPSEEMIEAGDDALRPGDFKDAELMIRAMVGRAEEELT